MREKLEKYVKSKYDGVIVWEYAEVNGTCYLRFTVKNAVYLATILKAGSYATIFKSEENVLI